MTTGQMTAGSSVRRILTHTLTALALTVPVFPAWASGGGGGGGGGGGDGGGARCPYQVDIHLKIGEKEIVVPSTLFTKRTNEFIDGFEVVIDANRLILTVITPDLEFYQTGLTRIEARSCAGFLAGPLRLVPSGKP